MIGHAFQLPRNRGDGRIQSQIAGHRLLTGNEKQALFLDRMLGLIDGVIASDQLIRQIGVTIGEGTDSLLLHPGDHRAEGQQAFVQSG